MSPTLVLIFSFVLPILILYLTYKILFSTKEKLPPSPPKLPIIGNLHQLGGQTHRSLDALAKKHGPLMFLKLGSIPTIVVSSGEMAREIMKTHDHIFASRPSLEFGRQLAYGSTDIGFAPYGEYWRQVRKIGVLHLLNAKKVESFRHVMREEVAQMIENINSSPNRIADLSIMLNSLSNDITSRVVFGKKYSGEEERNTRFFEMLKEHSALAGAFHVRDFFPRLGWLSKLSGLDARMKRQFMRWDGFFSKVIDDHLRAGSTKAHDTERIEDLVDVLLSLRQDESLTMDNIKAILGDMFSAGTDTSSITMEWTLAELVRNPTAMRRVQEEIRKFAKGKSMVEEDDISKMLYFKAVVKEVMRLHPPVPIMLQESIQPTCIGGYEIPAKARVLVNTWAIGRKPESWDAPEKFLPERFLDSSVDFKGHDFHYIPFGAGRRICPGILFAVSNMELALANLLYHFDWSLPDRKNPEQLDMSEADGITMGRKYNLLLLATTHNI